MFDLQVVVESIPLGLEGDSPAVGDVAATYGCLRSAEITYESTLVGGCHMVQEPGYCGGYF